MGSVLFTSALLLTGCNNLPLLNPKGRVAQDEKDLLITAVLLMLIIVIPVIFHPLPLSSNKPICKI
jgi:cytochrome o ubiquinol oxidase subunit II